MAITGMEAFIYGVEDLEASIRFHRDLGLEITDEGDKGADFHLLNGARVSIRPAGDKSLPPPRIDWLHMNHSTVREVIWSVDTAESLKALATDLSRDREVTEDADGVLHTQDALGHATGFAVTACEDLRVDLPEYNTVGNFGRRDRRAKGSKRNRAHPYRFSHMVYWVPNPSPEQVDFYVERLGFKITDLPNAGTFMRCEVMMTGTHLESQGWKTNVGPLRHNIGSSLSWYLWNPAGGVVEILCDLDYAGEDWQVEEFDGSDPGFYGHAWVARPEHEHIKPAQWVDD